MNKKFDNFYYIIYICLRLKLSLTSKLLESLVLIASTKAKTFFDINFGLNLQLPSLHQQDFKRLLQLYLQNVPHEKLDSNQMNSITSFVNKPDFLEKIVNFAAVKATFEGRKFVYYTQVLINSNFKSLLSFQIISNDETWSRILTLN